MLVDSRPGLFYTMVVASVMLAYFVAVIPLDAKYQVLRPELVCLIVIYWIMSVPQHLGVTFAFFVGLGQGVLEQGVWGAHAFALVVVAFFSVSAYKRVKNLSVWQQSLWVFFLVSIHQMMANTVMSFSGYDAQMRQLLLSIVVTSLAWPVLLITLKRFRVSYRMV
jgi:rod shape-determining protein MreD